MPKIRVMHIIHQLGAGGAENGIINLVNHIDINRFDVSVCAFVAQGSQTFRLDRSRAELFEIGKGRNNDIRVPYKLYRRFRNWLPDIVHTHAWGTLCEGLIAAKCARTPVVIHGEHGTIQQRRHHLQVQRLVWQMADLVLSVSDHHACKMATKVGFPLKKILVVPNGVDSDRFGSNSRGQSVRKRLGCEPDDIVIGTVGRLVPVKNQRLLIDAFSRFSTNRDNLKLIIIGEGPLRSQLEKQAYDSCNSNRIQFLGRRNDVAEILAAMDIFVLTSHSEGMSNTILEAMSCRLPVVATAVGGNSELVVNNETGFLIPPNDAEALTETLTFLVDHADIRKEMGSQGRARVKKYFSLPVMIRNYENLYERCYRDKTGAHPTSG